MLHQSTLKFQQLRRRFGGGDARSSPLAPLAPALAAVQAVAGPSHSSDLGLTLTAPQRVNDPGTAAAGSNLRLTGATNVGGAAAWLGAGSSPSAPPPLYAPNNAQPPFSYLPGSTQLPPSYPGAVQILLEPGSPRISGLKSLFASGITRTAASHRYV